MSAVIMCIQEDRSVGQLYADVLRAEGHEVLSAHDGRSAFELLRRQTPDVVFMDIHLPRQDGFEILAGMRAAEKAGSPAVWLLGEGDITDDQRQRAAVLGALGVEGGPLSPDRLLGCVASSVNEREKKTSPPRFQRAPEAGSLRQVPIPELLRALHLEAFDGALLLDHGRKKKAIELRGGWPVSVKSNLVSECLGSFLVDQGRCTQAELDESIKRMRTGEGLQGEILIAMDVMDEAAVVDALQQHAVSKFLEIFSWRDGDFVIRRDAHVQRGSSIGIQGHPSNLIVEGVRRNFSLKQIDRYFEFYGDGYFAPCEDLRARLEEIDLDGDELAWLRGIDGTTPVAPVLGAPEAIRRFAFGLVSIEALRIEAVAGDQNALGSSFGSSTSGSSASDSNGTSQQDEALRVELARLANSMQNKDHYGVLDVARTAGDDEIRAAYASLAKQTHPDRFHGASSSVRQLATQVFDRIAQAYESIATAADRQDYATERSRGERAAAIEDEGRRALMAETEFQRGEARVAQRDYEGALLCFGRAMEHFPSEGEYRAHYGWCLYLCHPDNEVMLGEALEHCREGLKLAKDREKPYLLLGRLYKAMGRTVGAKKMFSRAVQIKPQCVEAMRELRIMNMRRDKDKGVLKRIFRR